MKLLDSYNPVSNPNKVIQIPVGHYAGFLFFLSGTTAAAKTVLATDDIGQVILSTETVNTVACSPAMLFTMNMRQFGAPFQITPAAGATKISWFVPATVDFTKFPNSFLCDNEGNMVLTFNAGASFASGVWAGDVALLEIYAIPSKEPSLFVPYFWEASEVISAAATAPFRTVPDLPNITDLYMLPDTPANISRLMFTVGVGGVTNVLEGSYNVFNAMSNIFDRIELGEVPGTSDASGTPTNLHVIFAKERNIAASISRKITVQATTSGAVTAKCLWHGIKPLGNRSFQSRNKINTQLKLAIATLPDADQTRAYKAIQTSLGIS